MTGWGMCHHGRPGLFFPSRPAIRSGRNETLHWMRRWSRKLGRGTFWSNEGCSDRLEATNIRIFLVVHVEGKVVSDFQSGERNIAVFE